MLNCIVLHSKFYMGTDIECVHDLGFSCQLGDFWGNTKAFLVSKGSTLF